MAPGSVTFAISTPSLSTATAVGNPDIRLYHLGRVNRRNARPNGVGLIDQRLDDLGIVNKRNNGRYALAGEVGIWPIPKRAQPHDLRAEHALLEQVERMGSVRSRNLQCQRVGIKDDGVALMQGKQIEHSIDDALGLLLCYLHAFSSRQLFEHLRYGPSFPATSSGRSAVLNFSHSRGGPVVVRAQPLPTMPSQPARSNGTGRGAKF